MLSLIIASCLVTLMPGPSLVVIMMNAVQRGMLSGTLTVVGAVLADAILLALTLSSVGTVLHTSPVAFAILKWGGVAYLVYMGVVTLRSKVGGDAKVETKQKNAFLQGLGVTLLNPKIISFFVAFFPQFLDPQKPATPQIMILGPVFLVTVFFTFLACAVFAASLRNFFESPRGQLTMRNATGIVLIGCGLFAATM